MGHNTGRMLRFIRMALPEADSPEELELLRAYARERCDGPAREDLERLVDRRAAELAGPSEQLTRDVKHGGADRDAG